MKITLLALLMIMVGYFLLLYGGVGFMQDKRFFSSAPKENLAAIPDKKEHFRGAHAISWIIVALAVLLFLGAFALAALNGIKNGFGFSRFFLRFFIMLYGMELYDILFFDWVQLCHSKFFPHFYPELKGIVGPHMFGYNKNPTFCISFYICPSAPCSRGSALSFNRPLSISPDKKQLPEKHKQSLGEYFLFMISRRKYPAECPPPAPS